ncbi:MAG TPA: ribosome maturation factor RimP [Clostridia bacterium]|nr:ribosome maturation factor RimP [Clostridia bacterium]
MTKSKVEQIVYELSEPIIRQNGMELVDVEFKKEGKNWFLRIFIDKPDGVGIDDCQLISEKISCLLDEHDPISRSYYLEVSSPGIERPLKKPEHFARFKGEKAQIKTYKPIENSKKFSGIIGEVTNDTVVLIIGPEKEIVIPFEQIAKANLIYEF